MTLSDDQVERYSRQIIVSGFGGLAQRRLLAARLAIVGETRDVEPVLAYIAGAGVGAIELRLAGFGDAAALIARVSSLNPDSRITAERGRQPPDATLILIGGAQSHAAAQAAHGAPQGGAIVLARLSPPEFIATFPKSPPCPACADLPAADKTAPRSEFADFLAMAAATETLKLLAGYGAARTAEILLFGPDLNSTTRPARQAAPCSCADPRVTDPAAGEIGADASRARVWLLDFDNTIALLEPAVDWSASRRELEPMLRAAGAPEDLFAKIPRGNLPLYDALLARLRETHGATLDSASLAMLTRASEHIERYEIAGVERAEPLAGALELLDALRARGRVLAIVTSNSSRTVRRWLERFGRESAVAAIVGRDSMLALKPAPAMVLRALELTAAHPTDAVFLGDSPADLAAARASGVPFVGIAARAQSRQALVAAGATVVFDSLAELRRCLEFPPER